MNTALDQLQSTLKARGLHSTQARERVFTALLDKEPQTMQQIVAGCPDIDRTSVYRAIKLFEQLGIAQKLQIGWKYKIELSDAFHSHHHHLSCLRCGKIISFEEGDKLRQLLANVAREHQFDMREHQLEIQGLCQNCRPQFA